MATLQVVGVPGDVKDRFKAICRDRGVTMSAAVLDFMKQSVGEEIMDEAIARFRRRRFRK